MPVAFSRMKRMSGPLLIVGHFLLILGCQQCLQATSRRANRRGPSSGPLPRPFLLPESTRLAVHTWSAHSTSGMRWSSNRRRHRAHQLGARTGCVWRPHRSSAMRMCRSKSHCGDSLAFPGIFKGVLESGASAITDDMNLAVAERIAKLVKSPKKNEIVPKVTHPDLVKVVSATVKRFKNKILREE